MNPIRKVGLRLEMAEGRVQAIRHGDCAGPLNDAEFDRDSERNLFRLMVAEATGIDPDQLSRLLAI